MGALDKEIEETLKVGLIFLEGCLDGLTFEKIGQFSFYFFARFHNALVFLLDLFPQLLALFLQFLFIFLFSFSLSLDLLRYL